MPSSTSFDADALTGSGTVEMLMAFAVHAIFGDSHWSESWF